MFADLLKKTLLTKAELSRRLGVDKRTVSVWRDNPPQYAIVYLELLAGYNNLLKRLGNE